MHTNKWIGCIIWVSLSMSAPITAAPEQLQVPQCLATKMTSPHRVLAENKQFKIIEVSAAEVDVLSHLADKVHCGRFINVSHRLKNTISDQKKQSARNLLQKKIVHLRPSIQSSYEIKHQQEVSAALSKVVSETIWQNLVHLTSYYNRSAIQDSGVEVAQWLKSTFTAMASNYDRTDTSAYFVKTGHYKQPSLVTVIGKDIKAPGIVIGAHMDTLDGHMPGAGDDGSGSASIMEMARVLLASETHFKRPIYIIWYAAEERGLVGSQCVVNHFKERSIPVKAVIQFDMTGYRVNPEDPTMWIFKDHTDKALSDYVAKLIKTYIQVPVAYSRCGYGCSDHASWNKAGIPAAFPCESSFDEHNPYIHSENDTIDLINLEHMTNFSKLALAFAIELASE